MPIRIPRMIEGGLEHDESRHLYGGLPILGYITAKPQQTSANVAPCIVFNHVLDA